MSAQKPVSPLARRFRGFLPVVIDVETAGFNSKTDALLELAAVMLRMTEEGYFELQETHAFHIIPFAGANLDEAALAFTGIDPYHPFRFAVSEHDALTQLFASVRQELRNQGCSRAILVGHNPSFDLAFLKAAVHRTGLQRNPFHSFTTFDTATLGGLAFGQTVLARAVQAAGLEWDEKEAHSARYDAERTAQLFCTVLNQWQGFIKADGVRAGGR